MEVGVGAVALLLVRLRHVVVDDDVDALDVDAAADQVGRHQDALLPLLERLVHLAAMQGRDALHSAIISAESMDRLAQVDVHC